MALNTIYNEECIAGMRARVADKSVDLILCDLPYGITGCAWDSIIPFEDLWVEYERVIKDDGVIVLTASQPFTSALVMSRPHLFRYEWIWEKDNASNFQLAKKQPLKTHENILVFSRKAPKYNPQGLVACNKVLSNKNKAGRLGHLASEKKRESYVQEFTNYPKSIQRFNRERGLHPTQKPVELFEFLIKTYSDAGGLVLDNCMGSGTTAIAALNTERNFVGFELDKEYHRIASERVQKRMAEIIAAGAEE